MSPCRKCGGQPRPYHTATPRGNRGNGYVCCGEYTGTHTFADGQPLSKGQARTRWDALAGAALIDGQEG